MLRNNALEEISDGKLYGREDMVKVNCGGCRGCSSCCHNMGDTVVLDPFDFARMSVGLQKLPQELITEGVTLGVIDGLVLPHLRVQGRENACYYLDGNGRCSIHAHRPGICRLFPLGRYYHEETFSYILQVNECRNQNRSKMKVKQWIDTPNLKEYEEYILCWHHLLKRIGNYLENAEKRRPEICTAMLETFYFRPYGGKAYQADKTKTVEKAGAFDVAAFYFAFDTRVQEFSETIRK
ncbi:MAG: YkgJ family cysteine cluster protein [Lachnospiraceae bacterium]